MQDSCVSLPSNLGLPSIMIFLLNTRGYVEPQMLLLSLEPDACTLLTFFAAEFSRVILRLYLLSAFTRMTLLMKNETLNFFKIDLAARSEQSLQLEQILLS